jgi:phosphoribosylanthranilate isomerase
VRPRIKICGITREEDALLAAWLGADALGLVFYPASSRAVNAEQAAQLTQRWPAFVSRVGLFVNPSQHEVEQVLAQVHLDLLQFHGDESAEFCRSFGRPYIKALAVTAERDLAQDALEFSDAAALLLDTPSPLYGGTGQCFDWSLLRPVAKYLSQPLILAGGLNSANVAQALELTRVYAVDVSSGVESAKGIKDSVKLKQFFKEVFRVQPTFTID